MQAFVWGITTYTGPVRTRYGTFPTRYGPDAGPILNVTDPIRARYEPYTDGCRPHTVRVWAKADPMRTDTDPIRGRYGAYRDRCRLNTVRIPAHYGPNEFYYLFSFPIRFLSFCGQGGPVPKQSIFFSCRAASVVFEESPYQHINMSISIEIPTVAQIK